MGYFPLTLFTLVVSIEVAAGPKTPSADNWELQALENEIRLIETASSQVLGKPAYELQTTRTLLATLSDQLTIKKRALAQLSGVESNSELTEAQKLADKMLGMLEERREECNRWLLREQTDPNSTQSLALKTNLQQISTLWDRLSMESRFSKRLNTFRQKPGCQVALLDLDSFLTSATSDARQLIQETKNLCRVAGVTSGEEALPAGSVHDN